MALPLSHFLTDKKRKRAILIPSQNCKHLSSEDSLHHSGRFETNGSGKEESKMGRCYNVSGSDFHAQRRAVFEMDEEIEEEIITKIESSE